MGNDKEPMVSIVTPACNQAIFLRDTIESVLSQDYKNIEYIVIDDGSTDETLEILETYGQRFSWFTQENCGQTPTINRGWSLAKGEILAWLNSDDTLLPSAVSKAVAFLKTHPDVSIVYGDTLFTDANGKPLYRSPPQRGFSYDRFVLECHNPIPQPSAFVRRRVIEDVEKLDPYYKYFMDWDFWLRAGIRHRIECVPELLSTYRLHPASNTVAKQAQVAPELARMYEKYFDRADIPDNVRRQSRRAMANMYFTSAGYCARGGERGKVAASALQALRVYPELVLKPRMVRKLFYCFLGETRLVRNARAWRRRRANSSQSPVAHSSQGI